MITVNNKLINELATKSNGVYLTGKKGKIRNKYFIIDNNYFMELGVYKKHDEEFINVMRFSERSLDYLDDVTVGNSRYYPTCSYIGRKYNIQQYLLEREGLAVRGEGDINHKNGIICDNVLSNLEQISKQANLADRHIFTKNDHFEVDSERAFVELIGLLNGSLPMNEMHKLVLKRNVTDFSRNPKKADYFNTVTVREFYQSYASNNLCVRIENYYKIRKL